MHTLAADMQHDPLAIHVRPGKTADSRVVQLEGPLTTQTLFAFQTQLRKDETPVTILDFAGVPYMDSAGMGALLNYYVSCQKNNRKLILAAVSERIHALLELTNTVKLLSLVPTVADAE